MVEVKKEDWRFGFTFSPNTRPLWRSGLQTDNNPAIIVKAYEIVRRAGPKFVIVMVFSIVLRSKSTFGKSLL